MADDVNPALRAEIVGALAKIEPVIEGLLDLTKIDASVEFRQFAVDQYNEHLERERLLNSVLADLDNVNDSMATLEANGYPAPIPSNPDAAVFRDMEQQRLELLAALEVFGSAAPAETLTVKLGVAKDKA